MKIRGRSTSSPKILKLLSIICFALPCSAALAQGKEEPVRWESIKLPGLKNPMHCHPGDATKCVVRLEKGEESPFTGMLQTDRQTAELVVRAEGQEKRIQEAVEHQKKLDDVDLLVEKHNHDLDLKTCADKEKMTEDNHKRQLDLVSPNWYEKPPFVIFATSVVIVGVIGGSVAIGCQLRGC